MASRERDWLSQAEHDLAHARDALAANHYEWACFSAQQAAEKSLKAVYQHFAGDVRGHDLVRMFRGLSGKVQAPARILEMAAELSKHYISPRYPNAHAEGAPFEHYTRTEATRAIRHAEAILRFCRSHLA